MSGSGLFDKQRAAKPHLLRGGGGVAGEVADLRRDIDEEMAPMTAITCDEYVNPAAAAAAGLRVATQPLLAVQTLTDADLIAGGLTAIANGGRNVTFTTAGSTPADAPNNATVTGTDVNGDPQTEVIAVAQTATISSGVKAFKTITSIEFEAGGGAADCTVAIGFGNLLGLSKTPKARAGIVFPISEHAAGAKATNGVLNATNKTYAPNTVPNASHDYIIHYEYDPTV